MKKLITCISLCLTIYGLQAQNRAAYIIDSLEVNKPTVFDQNWLIGFAVNNSWANYDDFMDSSFYRPSLGIHLKTDLFITEWLGLTAGFGIQQRGMGVYTPDVNKSIGDPDSTGRLRYKTVTLDMPIQLLLRPKWEIFKNGRLVLGAGITPSYVKKAERIWKSVDDGFHVPTDITNRYKAWDFPMRFTLGTDIAAFGNNLFRVQFVYEMGRQGIYQTSSNGAYMGKNVLFGIDLSFLY